MEAFKKRREAKGKKVKTVSFAKDDMVRVHPIATYKRWNHRQYIFVCSHLSYFEENGEGQEDELVEENFDQPMGDVEMTPAEIEREQLSRESHVEEDLNFNSTFSLAEVEAPRIRKKPFLGIEGLMDEDLEEEQ